MADSCSGVIIASPLTTTIVAGTVFAPRSRVGVRIVICCLSCQYDASDAKRLDGMWTCDLIAVFAAIAPGEVDDFFRRDTTGVDPLLVGLGRPVRRNIVEHHVVRSS